MSPNCCNITTKNRKQCKREDGKIFSLPRRFTKKQCKNVKGFTMRSSCAPYKFCKKGGSRKKSKKKSRTIPSCVAKLFPDKNIKNLKNNKVNGIVLFFQYSQYLEIKYTINNLKDGEHGFHIHKCGDITEGCASGCQHFNPYNQEHGGLKDEHSHAGDLGNIKSKNGVSKGVIKTNKISIKPGLKNSIIGRMIIVHEDRDDLGLGDNDESKKTGNAGKRLACGIIGIKNE